MNLQRWTEYITVPLALAWAGWHAVSATTQVLRRLGHDYTAIRAFSLFQSVLVVTAFGFAAGLVAVACQANKDTPPRWSFYGLLALSLPVSAVIIVAIEMVRSRGLRPDGLSADISTVPFWILAIGFGIPFVFLLRK